MIPTSSSFLDISGSSSALRTSVSSRATVGAGNPAGPMKPNHDGTVVRFGSVSFTVGRSGRCLVRWSKKMPSSLILPVGSAASVAG